MILFLERLYTLKYILSIKVWITLYKPSMCVCRCEIRLGCYVHPLRDSTSSLKFAPPLFKMTRGAALISSVMTQPRPAKILSALGLNKTRTVLFLECSYTLKILVSLDWVMTRLYFFVRNLNRFKNQNTNV